MSLQIIGGANDEDDYDENENRREFMNQIRAVARQPRRQRRRKAPEWWQRLDEASKRQSSTERESAKFDAIVRRLDGLFTASDRKKSEKLLATDFKLAALQEPSIPAIWTAIGMEPRRAFLVDGDALHRQALKLVYSVFVMVATDSGVTMHIYMIIEQRKSNPENSITKKQQRQISSADDVLRAIIRLTLELGHCKDESYQVWRMAAAIRWFISKRIPPQGVEKEYQKNGGGLNKWSRDAPKTIGSEKKEIALEVEALVADSHYSPFDEAYLEDKQDDQRRWDDPPKIPEFESIFLRYCVNTVGVKPGGFLLLGVLGDDAAPLQARVRSVIPFGADQGQSLSASRGYPHAGRACGTAA